MSLDIFVTGDESAGSLPPVAVAAGKVIRELLQKLAQPLIVCGCEECREHATRRCFDCREWFSPACELLGEYPALPEQAGICGLCARTAWEERQNFGGDR